MRGRSPAVYDPNAFEARVSYAAQCVLSGVRSRSFDTCFEMYDGDFVAEALMRRVEKNPNSKLAQKIWSCFNREHWMSNRQYQNLSRSQLRTSAQEEVQRHIARREYINKPPENVIIVRTESGQDVTDVRGEVAIAMYAANQQNLPRVFKLESSEKFFVLEIVNGEIVTRAGQSSRYGAMQYMTENTVLYFRKGCGTPTNVEGTNGGAMPCGAMLTAFGKAEPYFCAVCEPGKAA